jgi:hypothetical protein
MTPDFERMAFINLAHHVDNSRIFYIKDKNVFYMTHVTLQEIRPHEANLLKMSVHIFSIIKDCPSNVNLTFGYPKDTLSKRQKKRLESLLNDEDQDITIHRISQWLTLLLN